MACRGSGVRVSLAPLNELTSVAATPAIEIPLVAPPSASSSSALISSALISIVIPVRNEAANLDRLLPILIASGAEVIVVDGGSQDESLAIAHRHGAITLSSAAGRAQQMNAGAAIATGQILFFLHADTQLPEGFQDWMRAILDRPGVVAGAFSLAIDGPGWGLRLVEWGVALRSQWRQMPYGDQGLFLRRDRFEALGGFPLLPIMEDFVLVDRLRKQGKIAIVPTVITTSARRWQTLGVWRTTLINQMILLGYGLGIPPDRLAHWYRHQGRQ
jgi:rSAM/selenodomain-associated transferase 2